MTMTVMEATMMLMMMMMMMIMMMMTMMMMMMMTAHPERSRHPVTRNEPTRILAPL